MNNLRRLPRIAVALFALWTSVFKVHALEAEVALFLSGDTLRKGCIYRPEGKGPFPAIVYAQASNKPSIEAGDKQPFFDLARSVTARGYVLFIPGRRVGDGTFVERKGKEDVNKLFMDAMKFHEPDIEAAIEWIKAQSYVNEKKIVLLGHSTGATQVLLLAPKPNAGIRGVVAFSPGAKIWSENGLLRESLLDSVKTSKVPIFLIQPQNDFGLGPISDLGPELEKRGKPNRSVIFPPYGKSQMDANSFAFNAPSIWAAPVFAFLEEVLQD